MYIILYINKNVTIEIMIVVASCLVLKYQN